VAKAVAGIGGLKTGDPSSGLPHDQRFDGWDELNHDVEPADPTVHDANEELRRALLERCGLLEPGPDPELS
jgi:hypothetical protein